MTEKDLIKLYRSFYIVGDTASLKILYELERFGEKTFTELKDSLSINPATLSKKLKILTQKHVLTGIGTEAYLHVYYGIHKHRRPLKRVLDAIDRLSTDL